MHDKFDDDLLVPLGSSIKTLETATYTRFIRNARKQLDELHKAYDSAPPSKDHNLAHAPPALALVAYNLVDFRKRLLGAEQFSHDDVNPVAAQKLRTEARACRESAERLLVRLQGSFFIKGGSAGSA